MSLIRGLLQPLQTLARVAGLAQISTLVEIAQVDLRDEISALGDLRQQLGCRGQLLLHVRRHLGARRLLLFYNCMNSLNSRNSFVCRAGLKDRRLQRCALEFVPAELPVLLLAILVAIFRDLAPPAPGQLSALHFALRPPTVTAQRDEGEVV